MLTDMTNRTVAPFFAVSCHPDRHATSRRACAEDGARASQKKGEAQGGDCRSHGGGMLEWGQGCSHAGAELPIVVVIS